MAITINATTTPASVNGTNPWTVSHTTGSGLSNSIMIVGIGWTTTTSVITSMTYAGAALTQVVTQSGNRRTEIWYLIGPAAGANNLVITWGVSQGRSMVSINTYSSANSSQNFTSKTANTFATSATPSLACGSASGEMVFGFLMSSFTAGETLTTDASQSERSNQSAGSSRMGACDEQSSGSSTTEDWVLSASKAHGIVAASFQPAVASGQPGRTLVGVGA